MNALVQIAVTNALVATGLALLACLVAICFRRPALTHAVWVLVLIKLLTPPLFDLRLPVIPVEFARSEGVASTPPPPLVAVAITRPVPIRKAGSATVQARATPQIEQPAAVPATSRTVPAAVRPLLTRVPVTMGLLALWGLGTILWIVYVARDLSQLARVLRSATIAPPDLQFRAQELASRLGLRRAPLILLVPQAVPPMLCWMWPGHRLVFPTPLLARLSPEARDTLIMHELAHYGRGDHWVRVLEIVATGLFWWHPVVWWARRSIEITQEECCDAWVVGQLPDSPRRYADALLDAIDFVAEHRPALPPVACGIGDVPLLKRRLRQIMRRSVPRTLSGYGRLCLVSLSVIGLPIQPILEARPVQASSGLSQRPGASPKSLKIISVQDPKPAAAPREIPSEEDGYGPIPVLDDLDPQKPWAIITAPDGETRIVAHPGRKVVLEKLRSAEEVDLSEQQPTSIAYLQGGRRLLIGGGDGRVSLWDAHTVRLIAELGAHPDEVVSVSASPDGTLAASGSRDGMLTLWDLTSRQVVYRRTQSAMPVAAVRFSPGGAKLAATSGDWRHREALLSIMNIQQVEERSGFVQVEAASTQKLSLVPAAIEFQNEDTLSLADWSGEVSLLQMGTGAIDPLGRVGKDVVTAAAYAPDQNLLAVVEPYQFTPAAVPQQPWLGDFPLGKLVPTVVPQR